MQSDIPLPSFMSGKPKLIPQYLCRSTDGMTGTSRPRGAQDNVFMDYELSCIIAVRFSSGSGTSKIRAWKSEMFPVPAGVYERPLLEITACQPLILKLYPVLPNKVDLAKITLFCMGFLLTSMRTHTRQSLG